MQRLLLNGLVRRLAPESPDGELLERFLRDRCDDAFAQLVVRYSRLVWGQCRALLPNDADAEDAFQATFLTLARSAKTVRPGAPLGPWLHGVAYRVCLNARRADGRRAKREKRTAVPVETRPVADSAWDAAFAAVAEEVQKLPETQRAAFVLCCVEARPAPDAAAALKVSPGTLATRLSRAKQTLLDRLAARGLGAAAVALGGVAVSAAPASAVNSTLILISAGSVIPRSVQLLTQGVTGMAALRFKLLAAGVVVAAGLGLTGGGFSFAQEPKPNPVAEDWQKLLLAERDAREQAERRAEEFARAATKYDATAPAGATPTTQRKAYEYEQVPGNGFTEKQFEEIVAKREAAGWQFLGQVTLRDRGMGVLAFRNVPAAAVVDDRREPKYNSNSPVRNPVQDPAYPARAADAPYNLNSLVRNPVQDPAYPARAADVPPKAPGSLQYNPMESQDLFRPRSEAALRLAELARQKAVADERSAKIAALEKELRDLKAARVPADEPVREVHKTFSSADFTGWDAQKVTEVIGKLMADDLQSKKIPGPLQATPIQYAQGIKVVGSPEAVAAFKAWLDVLKK